MFYVLHLFRQWNDEQQQEFLNFCTGTKGIKILYDSVFKEIMNPETAPERLEEFLSLVLGQSCLLDKEAPAIRQIYC